MGGYVVNVKVRTLIRFIIFFVCLFAIIYFQRTTGVRELGFMLLALGGMLAAIYDYNYEFNHPKRD